MIWQALSMMTWVPFSPLPSPRLALVTARGREWVYPSKVGGWGMELLLRPLFRGEEGTWPLPFKNGLFS